MQSYFIIFSSYSRFNYNNLLNNTFKQNVSALYYTVNVIDLESIRKTNFPFFVCETYWCKTKSSNWSYLRRVKVNWWERKLTGREWEKIHENDLYINIYIWDLISYLQVLSSPNGYLQGTEFIQIQIHIHTQRICMYTTGAEPLCKINKKHRAINKLDEPRITGANAPSCLWMFTLSFRKHWKPWRGFKVLHGAICLIGYRGMRWLLKESINAEKTRSYV